jgi:hypothetical protein
MLIAKEDLYKYKSYVLDSWLELWFASENY